MKPTDDKLERLLQAAAKAPSPGSGDIPLGLETRVLAEWRAGQAGDDSIFLFTFLRRALLGAALVLAMSAAWSLSQPPSDAWGDGESIISAEHQAGLNP